MDSSKGVRVLARIMEGMGRQTPCLAVRFPPIYHHPQDPTSNRRTLVAGRSIFTVPASALAGLLVASSATAQEAASPPLTDVPRLVDQRTIVPEDARIISMSPDGRSIAAVRPAIGYQRGALCVVDLETLLDRACADLSVLPAGLRLQDVTWSPDSSRLAFAEQGFLTFVDGDLWVMDAATGALTNVDDDGWEGDIPFFDGGWPEDPISLPVTPAFSPDGSTLAFSRSMFSGDGARWNVIATVPTTGGPITDLVTVDAEEAGISYLGLAWAPDGGRLYYSVHRPQRDSLGNGVWVVDADGTGARLLVGRYQGTHGPAVLAVAGDGATLLLEDPEAAGSYAGQLPAFATADAASGVPEPLLPVDPGAPKGTYVSWAGFSPDGRWVLTLDRLGPPTRVRVRAVGASTDVELVPGGIEHAGPVDRGLPMTWSENGTALLTGSGRFDTATLLTIEGGGAE